MKKNVKVVSFQRSPAYVHHRAMMNRRDNNVVDALELMRRAVEESPENREYRLDLAELYCEMGCHAQSTRLLLDMLAEEDSPSECYYGLALNQLGMNDLTGARRYLRLYRRHNPEASHSEEVRQLTAQLDFFHEISRHENRRLQRAIAMANRACEAMKADEPQKACRLFEASLALSSEQYEMRALYAMALLLCGERDSARAEAELAYRGYPPSVRALCVSAQVFALLGDGKRARRLIERAVGEKPEGQDLRLMLYAMGELGMDELVAEHVRAALREAPFDRELLHMRAVALMRTGVSAARASRFWARILRIDPEDSVARYYQRAALRGELQGQSLGYAYQVPHEEFMRRLRALVGQLSQGYAHLEALWRDDPHFRQLLRWAAGAPDSRLSRAAMTALTIIDHRESRSLLRSLLFSGEIPGELKLHAALALRLQGVDSETIMPARAELGDSLLPDPEEMLKRLGVGERRLVRYADQILCERYDISALTHLLLLWSAYRQFRGTAADPLCCVSGASAALAWNYLVSVGRECDADALARDFGCDVRQLVYYARRMAGCLERIGGNKP